MTDFIDALSFLAYHHQTYLLPTSAQHPSDASNGLIFELARSARRDYMMRPIHANNLQRHGHFLGSGNNAARVFAGYRGERTNSIAFPFIGTFCTGNFANRRRKKAPVPIGSRYGQCCEPCSILNKGISKNKPDVAVANDSWRFSRKLRASIRQKCDRLSGRQISVSHVALPRHRTTSG